VRAVCERLGRLYHLWGTLTLTLSLREREPAAVLCAMRLSLRCLTMLMCIVLCGTGLTACRSGDGLPDPSSKTYREAVAAFHTGLAAIQAGVEVKENRKNGKETKKEGKKKKGKKE